MDHTCEEHVPGSMPRSRRRRGREGKKKEKKKEKEKQQQQKKTPRWDAHRHRMYRFHGDGLLSHHPGPPSTAEVGSDPVVWMRPCHTMHRHRMGKILVLLALWPMGYRGKLSSELLSTTTAALAAHPITSSFPENGRNDRHHISVSRRRWRAASSTLTWPGVHVACFTPVQGNTPGHRAHSHPLGT